MLERGFEFAPGYRLQEFLGRGQFGQVWRASAPGGTAAAVKFIDLTEGSGQKEYAGVKRVKQIRHANLMPITAIWLLDKEGKVIEEPPDEATETIDVSSPGAHHSGMVVMPQVEPAWLVVAMLLGGNSLLHRLRDCTNQGMPGIPPKELLSYMGEAAKGLDFLNQPQHDLGGGPVAIQHCDVKPANIVMIGTSAVVCDFGLARILSRNQITATSASGTPAYMAPEAIDGKPSCSSDQYSLAVTYYHLRTGSLPLKEGSLFEVLDAHRAGRLDFSGVGDAEQAVLKKATDLDWQNRFASNEDFVDALREAIRGGQTRSTSAAGTTPAADHSRLTGPLETIGTTQGQNDTNESPLATIDTGFAAPRPDEVETVALSGQADDVVGSEGRVKGSWLKLKYVVPGSIACVLMLGLLMIPPSDGKKDQNGTDHEQADSEEIDGGGKQATKSAEQLLALAINQFDANEVDAAQMFAKAKDLNPSVGDITSRVLGQHSGAVERLLQTQDGSGLVTIGYDKSPYLWNLNLSSEASEPTVLLPTGSELIYPDALALSGDGKRILCGSGVSPYIWTIEAERTTDTQVKLPQHEDELLAVTWHPVDKPFVATASADGKIGVVELAPATVDSPHGSVARSKLFDSLIIAKTLAFDPGGEYLIAVGDQGRVQAISWKEITTRLEDDSALNAVPVNAEGTSAVCIDFVRADEKSLVAVGSLEGSITLWELGVQTEQRDRFAAHDQSPVEAIKVAHAGGGDVIAAAGGDGKISVWPVASPENRKTFAISSVAVAAVDLSADGRWVAAGGNDGTVWLWDHQAEKVARFISGADTVDSICIDSRGRWLIAGCGDGTIRMWDLVHCKLIALTVPVLQHKPEQAIPEVGRQAALSALH